MYQIERNSKCFNSKRKACYPLYHNPQVVPGWCYHAYFIGVVRLSVLQMTRHQLCQAHSPQYSLLNTASQPENIYFTFLFIFSDGQTKLCSTLSFSRVTSEL